MDLTARQKYNAKRREKRLEGILKPQETYAQRERRLMLKKVKLDQKGQVIQKLLDAFSTKSHT